MTITSFSFLLLVAVGLLVYYILPKSWQWVELLAISLFFYYFAATPYTILYLVVSTMTAYCSTMIIARIRGGERSDSRSVVIITLLAIGINVAIWFVVKGYDFWTIGLRLLFRFFNNSTLDALLNVRFVAALGMGYYTLQVVAYIIDCYWQTIEPQKNPLKLFLFVSFFPQLITGPISRYAQLEVLYQKHSYQDLNITHGAQRVLWGFFKKLVLAERVGIIVTGITSQLSTYTGFYTWIAILLYPLQLYADFSGCMDIVLGVAEMFGIQMAENFRNPFFSRTVQEFWQRWHITLGVWAKDYLLYPLLKTKCFAKLGKVSKKKFGKRLGKFLPTMAGMFVLWMALGIWHGGARYIVGVSLWYWMLLILGEWFSPVLQRLVKALGIRTDNFSWHMFQSIRTYLLVSIGMVFFNMGIRGGIALIRQAVSVVTGGTANPRIFFDRSILNLGVSILDIYIIVIAVFLLVTVAVLREKYGYARNWMDKQGVVFRWSVWLILFFIVLVFGKYDSGHEASKFIYQGF